MIDPPSTPPAVLSWSRGLASLPVAGRAALPRLRPDEWAETHRQCQEFVERRGMQAHAAGWDTLRLSGIHPEDGTIRFDWKGHSLTVNPSASATSTVDNGINSSGIAVGSYSDGSHYHGFATSDSASTNSHAQIDYTGAVDTCVKSINNLSQIVVKYKDTLISKLGFYNIREDLAKSIILEQRKLVH